MVSKTVDIDRSPPDSQTSDGSYRHKIHSLFSRASPDQNKHLADWLFQSQRANRAESGLPHTSKHWWPLPCFQPQSYDVSHEGYVSSYARVALATSQRKTNTASLSSESLSPLPRLTVATFHFNKWRSQDSHLRWGGDGGRLTTRHSCEMCIVNVIIAFRARNAKLSSVSFVLHCGIWRLVLHEK